MDKKDIMYVVAALAIILVVAVVVKPVMTGHPVNTGLAPPATPQETLAGIPASNNPGANITAAVPITTVPTLPTPIPTPPWNKSVQNVGFVDPSTYHLSMNESIPHGTRIDEIPVNNSLTTYATITGQYSGATQVINVPFPYWELWYTADPAGSMMGKDQSFSTSTITSANNSHTGSGSTSSGSGSTQTVIQGSFSVTNPTLSIQVMDANDPNRIVRTISPPGGLDSSLWGTYTTDSDVTTGGSSSTGSSSTTFQSGSTTFTSRSVSTSSVAPSTDTGNVELSNDPRPWKEKFFEGQRSYYFVINAHSLTSYSLKIMVPSRYVG